MQVESQVGVTRKLSPVMLGADPSAGNRKSSNGTIRPLKEEVLYSSKSLQLSEYTFEDPRGHAHSAEVIRRRYIVGPKNSESDADTILSIAILKRHILCDCLILVRQYRPTLKSYVLEFPARIIEQRENSLSGDYAVKDLKDNTGYGATVVGHISPETATDPDLCDSKVKLVSLVIDGDDPIKNNLFKASKLPKSREFSSTGSSPFESDTDNNEEEEEEEDDDVEIIPVPVNGLLDRLNEYCKRGTIVDSRVYAFAIGLKKGEKMSQQSANPENIKIAI